MDSRVHSLDAVRAIALLLGIGLHSTLSFLPGPQYWLVADSSRSDVLAVSFFVVHMFRMLTFFVIAGFFANLLLKRVGYAGFIRNRALRIALPLAMFWPVVITGITVVLYGIVQLKLGGVTPKDVAGPKFTPDDFPLTHLWFLWTLLGLYVLYIPIRAVLARTGGVALERLVNRAGALCAHPLFLLVLAFPVALALAAHPKWTPWIGIPAPDKSLFGNASSWIAYSLAFTVGVWLEARRHFLMVIQRSAPVYAILGLVALVGSILGDAWVSKLGISDFVSSKLISAWIYAVGAWTLTFAMLGFIAGEPRLALSFRRVVLDISHALAGGARTTTLELGVERALDDQISAHCDYCDCVTFVDLSLDGARHLVRCDAER
jgi:glucans biosynthesis protein C